MSQKLDIEFTLNGVKAGASVTAGMSALELLRDVLNLTGTKYGCGEGECGACTIMVDDVSVNACLTFAAALGGRRVQTIEGLATEARTEKLREAFVEHGAVQCGFCTPGMVMQAAHLLDKHPHADPHDIKRGIEGNLCRCTGYKKIVDAIHSVGDCGACDGGAK